MAKKRQTDEQGQAQAAQQGGRAINFKAPADLAADLDEIAEGLGLDVANLVRMVLKENLPQYRARVEEIKRQRTKGAE